MWSPFSVLFERRGGPITSSHALWEHLVGGARSLSGVSVTETSAMQVAAVSSCVRLIAGTIGSLPCDILERKDERTRLPAVTHPIRRLLTKPNPWQTWSEFISQQVAHVLLRGNSYAIMVRSGEQLITELLPLHPDQVRVEQASYPGLAVKYTWTAKDGRQYEVSPREMLHQRNLSTNGLTGRSVLDDARESLGVAIATQQHAASFWGRSGLPTVVLRHPNRLSEKAKTSLETHFEHTYGGGADQRRVAVLEEGMELTPISITAHDAQFLETRKFQRGEIAGLFQVPPHMIGDTEKSTSWGTGIEQQQIGFVTMTLGPLLVRLEQRMNADLLISDRHSIRFFVQGLMRGDVASRGAWYRIMREVGAFSANDIRTLEDMPPVVGGDTYLQPLNLAPLGSTPPPKPTA